MNWQEIYSDSSLNDLPYKIESNEWGQIVMTPINPINNRRSMILGLFMDVLPRDSGQLICSCPIDTRKGVKVVDIAWMTSEFFAENIQQLTCASSPKLCIDVIILGIATDYYADKRELYFEGGAQEVWLCDEQGGLAFYDCTGENPRLAPFPWNYPHSRKRIIKFRITMTGLFKCVRRRESYEFDSRNFSIQKT